MKHQNAYDKLARHYSKTRYKSALNEFCMKVGAENLQKLSGLGLYIPKKYLQEVKSVHETKLLNSGTKQANEPASQK